MLPSSRFSRASTRLGLHLRPARVMTLAVALLVGLGALGALATAATTSRGRHPQLTARQHAGKSRHRGAQRTGSAKGLGPISGILPRTHLTEQSAIRVDLSNETARLPIYRGTAPVPHGQPGQTETVWYVLLDASDPGLAEDLGVNYAPKLENMAISCAACVETVTQSDPTPAQNRFGQAVLHFKGAPDFSPTRIAVPGPTGFPLKTAQPGAVAGPGYSPFIRIAGSDVVYNAPIIAVGNSRFDVTHHTNTADRVLGIHIAPRQPSGRYEDSYADMLFIKGFDAGKPIIYLSTDAGQPVTAVIERATYVPALNQVSYAGGDDFLGSARERLFGFANGQKGPGNPQAQGFQHTVLDGAGSQDASAGNSKLINDLRRGGDLLEVFGDFPTLKDPRHADAYSPLWDAQLGLWTPKAIREGLDKRQTDENQVLNLAATRPDLLTSVDPTTNKPVPYGSVGIDINCAVIGFTTTAPRIHPVQPVPGGQFPPR